MKKFIIGMSLILIFSGLAFGAQQDESDLISLDFKGMDIRDVLKILSQKSGLNIVADSEVNGTVTLYLKDVSVMDAIGIIASINGLAYEQTGSLIRIMNEKDYEKVHGKSFEDRTKTEVVKLNYASATEAGKALAQMKSAIGKIISDDFSGTIVMIDSPDNIKRMRQVIAEMDAPLVTEVFPLDYAKAESIKDKISEMVSKDVGSVKFDEKTNKLVVKDTQQKIEDMRKVINAFDEKTREVLIDAYIVQVTLSDKYGYGIDWLDIAKMGGVKLTGDTNLSTGLSNVTPNTLSIATTGKNYTTIISLLKTYGETNVLSRPRIMVLDKHEARILVGSKEVYVTSDVTTTSGGTYHTTDNIQFVDVGVRLAVTPEINRAGFVTLKIKPEVSNADATKTVLLKNPDGSTRTVVPYVTTSEAETSVAVKDGTTIIIGGLMKDTLVDHVEKVPFLGDVPLLGKLFSAKGKTKEKTELVIFLTPHIIDGEKTTEEAKKYMADWENKMEEINIEKPNLPETKELVQAKPKTAAKRAEQPKRKWTPILGTSSREPEDAEEPVLAAGDSEVKNIETPYEEYYFTLRQGINNLAKQDEDVIGIKGDVQLQFTLDKEGFLIKGPIVLNNPDLRLVRSAVKIVKKAAPFIRFPKALKKDQADFSVVVRYE
ncbi:MAG: secretin N-terminal domain-containing protein [Candidatus Omnitrophota bacterium]|nr:secretin N-terminal domain-containing protein [Candidatus Omnitrophota bacterium]